MNANDRQVGGSHYQTVSKIQHWDIVYIIFGGDYLLGAASKYMARVGKKGDLKKSVEDLEKAIHYLEKKKEELKLQIVDKDIESPLGVPGQLFHKQPLIVKTVSEDGSPTSAYTNQD